MDYEQTVMQLIMHGGNARSQSMLELAKAREGDWVNAEELIEKANDEINAAHEVQTNLIQAEIRGENKEPVTLLMVHAQDHLMNAMTVRDLAREIIQIIKGK